MKDISTSLNASQQTSLASWATKTSMVLKKERQGPNWTLSDPRPDLPIRGKCLKVMAGTTRLELATSAVTVSGLSVLSTTWKSTDGTASHWKYVEDSVIVYRGYQTWCCAGPPLIVSKLHAECEPRTPTAIGTRSCGAYYRRPNRRPAVRSGERSCTLALRTRFGLKVSQECRQAPCSEVRNWGG